MDKCTVCGKKSKRFCPGLKDAICSYCCGTKRQKEIICLVECEYLKQGKEYQTARQISQEVSSNFNTEAEDIFQYSDEAIKFVAPLEKFFVKNFYNDKNVNDNNIYNALIKVYSFQTKSAVLIPADKCEELIFMEFRRMHKKFYDMSEDIKSKSILRILKSIKLSSGGILGSRNYLEMIDSQFRKDGKRSHLFGYE